MWLRILLTCCPSAPVSEGRRLLAVLPFGVLIAAMAIEASMLCLTYQFKVIKPVIRTVAIYVVNIVVWRDWSIGLYPDVSVQKATRTICTSIIAIGATSIAMSAKEYEGQRFGSFTQWQASSQKSFMYALARYTESFSDLLTAITRNIQLVHDLCRFDVWRVTHVPILHERLTSVNQCG